MKKYLLIVVLILSGCAGKKKHRLYWDRVNQSFVNQAEVLFGAELIELQSYSSYATNTVLFQLQQQDFDYADFLNNKKDELAQMNWVFYTQYNASYIFCDGRNQLEIIPPQSLVGNKKLFTGSTGMQLEKEWNILFMRPNHSTHYECLHFKKERKI